MDLPVKHGESVHTYVTLALSVALWETQWSQTVQVRFATGAAMERSSEAGLKKTRCTRCTGRMHRGKTMYI